MSASTVCGVGSTMSRRRLCVRISNWSRDFLFTCGPRRTVNFSILFGSGMGPRTCAPVRLAVATISCVLASQYTIVECLEPDADILALHIIRPFRLEVDRTTGGSFPLPSSNPDKLQRRDRIPPHAVCPANSGALQGLGAWGKRKCWKLGALRHVHVSLSTQTRLNLLCYNITQISIPTPKPPIPRMETAS